MDSGLLIAFWFDMLVAGFAVAAIVHFVFGRWNLMTILGSAVLPVLFDLARELYPWNDLSSDLLVLAGVMLIQGLIAAMIGALVGTWLGCGTRKFLSKSRSD